MAEGRKGWLLESRMQRWKAARLKRQPQIQEEGEGSATGGRDVGWGGEGLQWRETTGEHIIREGARGVRTRDANDCAPPARVVCARRRESDERGPTRTGEAGPCIYVRWEGGSSRAASKG